MPTREIERRCDDPAYRERARIQVLYWAQGRSYHEPINNECCPDFSCCVPNINTDASQRWDYYHRRYGARQ